MTDFPPFPSHAYSSCFIISHAHLDHVNGLVLSAGSLQGPRKRICASLHALKFLETIFADRIWPNLASWDADDAAHKLLYDPCVQNISSPQTLFLFNMSNAGCKYIQIKFRRGLQDGLPRRFSQGDARLAREDRRHARGLRVDDLLHPTRPFGPRVPLLRRRLPRQPRAPQESADDGRLARGGTQDTHHALQHLHRMFLAVRPARRAALRPPQPRAPRGRTRRPCD